MNRYVDGGCSLWNSRPVSDKYCLFLHINAYHVIIIKVRLTKLYTKLRKRDYILYIMANSKMIV